ncbi:hypothetical protein HPB50_000655 [Hyalomma asiaticum]|uniref:Uncharacterized protein n=1 Tax=Hyalomma asiaticum TaxID=266040 RepID=A0ACB7T521_HYAAI|nr:hypothetical protein HPB50_000655 [Hyalomma asiaticum]
MLRTKLRLPQRPHMARHCDKVALLFGAVVVMATILPAVQSTCDKEVCTNECLKTGWEYGVCCVPGGNGMPEVCRCYRHQKSSTKTSYPRAGRS